VSFICSLVIARAIPTLAITRNTKQLRLEGSTATSTQAYRLLRMVAPAQPLSRTLRARLDGHSNRLTRQSLVRSSVSVGEQHSREH
jgi:hypothetical protein